MSYEIGKAKSRYKGVFLAKVKVRAVENLSGQTLEHIGDSYDLAIKVSFDIGRDFDKTVTIFGNFKRKADGSYDDIGSAFKVCRFFETLGVKGKLTPTNEIPSYWITSVIGHECYILDYLVGVKENDPTKGKYYTWDMISTDEDYLVGEFYKSVKKGYPKKFNPTALDDRQDGHHEEQHPQGDSYEGPSDAPPIEEMAF
jgi:hypothetical protein